ncbi:MAG TPA: amidase, partial [Burkholderiaceae bacterium]|nr:amidase [Burkholderiaceae bacterium]
MEAHSTHPHGTSATVGPGSRIDTLLSQFAAGVATPAAAWAQAQQAAADPRAAHVLIRRLETPATTSAGALAGIPVTVKDLFDMAGSVTTAGSKVLLDGPAAAAPAERDATVVARLRAAGAAIIGTTNMTEFAYSGLGLNPHWGTPANAADAAVARIPGGSSCGAAVGVALGVGLAAVGTDTGGSVRIPAALNGLVGFKPTARRVPMDGCLPLAASLDSIGPIAHTLADCIRMDAVLADAPLRCTPPAPGQIRLLIPTTLVLDELDATVAQAFATSIERLQAAGVQIARAELAPFADAALAAQGVIAAYESFQWHAPLLARAAAAYDPRVSTRIAGGAQISALDYAAALHARQRWQAAVQAALQGCDAFVMPTVPRVAPEIAALADDAAYFAANRLMLRNTLLFNLLDGCALTLPMRTNSLPAGLMLGAPALHD